LVWRGRRTWIAVDDDILVIDDSSGTVDRVALKGLDYVRAVHGAIAELEGGGEEWLAVLVRLRATGRRELLLIYDPQGNRVHQELLARTRSGPGPVLWSAGAPRERQEFVLDIGQPVRYVVQR
jgi:hypothetical protein